VYATYIVKRTQIYLDDVQANELARRARTRGTTASKMIREAIDDYLAEPDDPAARRDRLRTALRQAFGIAPYLPDGATYVETLRSHDLEREAELDRLRDG
jgi:predicted DNA-binding protein